jgi:hypothetical protein
MVKKATQVQAIELCRMVEEVCPAFGCHVALTGGQLYKDGGRKDIDILFYRIRQVDKIDVEGLFEAIEREIGLKKVGGFGWCHKAEWNGFSVDVFFPEEPGGEYKLRRHMLEKTFGWLARKP